MAKNVGKEDRSGSGSDGYVTPEELGLTQEQLDEWVEEAERGYDPAELTMEIVVGRPSLGERGASPQMRFRVSPDMLAAAQRRADEEGRSLSDLGREALRRYLESPET